MIKIKQLAILVLITTNYLFAQQPMRINSSVGMASTAKMAVYGDLFANETLVKLNGEVHFNSGPPSLIKSPANISIRLVEFNMKNSVTLETELAIMEKSLFNSGIVYTNRNLLNNYFLHFIDNATYSGANNKSFVDGTVAKTGNDAFSFPIGEKFQMNMLSIDAPNSTTSKYKAYFKNKNVKDTLSTTSAVSCTKVLSKLGYWYYGRLEGTDDAIVTLNYGPNMLASGLTCNNVIASYDGSAWLSEGNGGITGTNSAGGTITSGTGCGTCGTSKEVTNYNFLTVASTLDPTGPLPVRWLSFGANRQDKYNALLYWSIAEEFNNSHFIIEKSLNAKEWTEVAKVQSAGNTKSVKNYQYLDKNNPNTSIIYYRLKQVDFDGKSSFNTNIVSLKFGLETNEEMIAYPNPTINWLNVNVSKSHVGSTLTLEDKLGQLKASINNISENESINLSTYANGLYLLKLIDPKTQKILKETKIIKI